MTAELYLATIENAYISQLLAGKRMDRTIRNRCQKKAHRFDGMAGTLKHQLIKVWTSRKGDNNHGRT